MSLIREAVLEQLDSIGCKIHNLEKNLIETIDVFEQKYHELAKHVKPKVYAQNSNNIQTDSVVLELKAIIKSTKSEKKYIERFCSCVDEVMSKSIVLCNLLMNDELIILKQQFTMNRIIELHSTASLIRQIITNRDKLMQELQEC